MLQITLPQLRQWQLGQLHEWATGLETTAHNYAWQLHRTANCFLDLDDFWISDSATAASSWMRSESASGARLASEIGNLVASVRSDLNRIARERERLLGTVAETEAAGSPGLGQHPVTFSVDSHWRVQADHTMIRNSAGHILEKITIETDSRQVQVSRAYAVFATTVDELTSKLVVAADKIGSRAQSIRDRSNMSTGVPTMGLHSPTTHN